MFDLVKLSDISKDIVATYSAEQVYTYGLDWAEQHNQHLAHLLKDDPDYSIKVFNIERTAPAPRKDIVNWSDIERACGFFFDKLYDESIAAHGYPFPKVQVADMVAILEHMRAFDPAIAKDDWLDEMRGLTEQIGFARDAKTFKKHPADFKGHFGDVMMVVRVALTGRTNTPDLYEILQIFGGLRIERRIIQVLSYLEKF